MLHSPSKLVRNDMSGPFITQSMSERPICLSKLVSPICQQRHYP